LPPPPKVGRPKLNDGRPKLRDLALTEEADLCGTLKLLKLGRPKLRDLALADEADLAGGSDKLCRDKLGTPMDLPPDLVTVFNVVAWSVTVTVTVRTGMDRIVGIPSLGIFVVREKIVLRMGKPVGITMGTERVATVVLPTLPVESAAAVVPSWTVTVEASFVTVVPSFVTVVPSLVKVEATVETWLSVTVEVVSSPVQCSMKPIHHF